MNHSTSSKSLLGALLTSLVAASAPAQNLVTNPGFETPVVASYASYTAGNTSITGWTVDTTPGDGVQLQHLNAFGPNSGSQSLQLTGASAYNVGGGVQQTITTTPGQTYNISIALGSRSANNAKGWFNFGGVLTPLTGPAKNTFVTNTWQATATSASTLIDIFGTNTAASAQLIIDNVSVTAVPSVAATPSLSPGAGSYLAPLTVTITGDATATVFYTTDGSTPTSTSLHGPEGSGSATVTLLTAGATTVNAYATNSAVTDSAVASVVYQVFSTPAVPTWIAAGGGSWADPANWSNNVVATGAGATANFSTLTLTANTTVTLDGARTVGNLIFDDQNPIKNNWIVNAGTGGPLTLAVASGSAVISNAAPVTIGVALAGIAALTKTGNNVLTLAAANTYSGATTNRSGSLVFSNSSTPFATAGLETASGAVTEVNYSGGGTFYINNGYNCLMTGSGTLRKTGTGVWGLANGVAKGIISLGSGGLLDVQAGEIGDTSHNTIFTNNLGSLNVASGAIATMGGNDWTVDALTGDGTVRLNYTEDHLLTVGVNNGSGTFAGVLSQGPLAGTHILSLTKTGSGTQVLSGPNSYSGATTVNAGTLVVDGFTGSGAVTVQTNATLAGLGTVGGPLTVQSGGTVAPGGSVVGTLTTGDETWNPGTTIACKIASADPANSAARDYLSINGTLFLDALTNGTATIKLVSMASSNTPGLVPDFNAASNYTWTVGIATSGVSASLNLANVVLDTSSFSNPHGGAFSLVPDLVNYTVSVQYTAATTVTPPTLSAFGPLTGSSFPLRFSGPDGQTYKILSTTNIALPLTSWSILGSGTFSGSPVTFTDTSATNAQRFYRITSP
jgi:autotransporter-associated beta strand protein